MIWAQDINVRIYRHLQEGAANGSHLIALQGARRSGKTYTICQFLLNQCLQNGDTIIAASMTSEQGRKGAYSDMKDILRNAPLSYSQYFDVMKSPAEIRCKATPNGREGIVYFSSFQDPETAKGGACDWVFINEANKFTKQQYLDLAANARKGVIIDYNPQCRFWIDDYPECVPLKCSWWNNRHHLTPSQLRWFADVKAAAMKPNATAADWFYYSVYFLGEYYGLSGNIFTRANIHIVQPADVPHLMYKVLFVDPSALRGEDYFAMVLAGLDARGDMWVLDVDSVNTGSKAEQLQKMRAMAAKWDGVNVYIESNGLVGAEFRDYCDAQGFDCNWWGMRGNKFERIVAHYQELTKQTHFVDSYKMGDFLAQVYEFSAKCEHDDNIDAVNSAWQVLQFIK